MAFSSASDMWLPVQSVASGSEETSSLAPEGTLKDREPRRGITFFLIPPACRYVLMLLGVWVLLQDSDLSSPLEEGEGTETHGAQRLFAGL